MHHARKSLAMALGLGLAFAAASSSQALTTFASYAADPSVVQNMSWTNTGFSSGTLANLAGDADGEAGVTDTRFSFLIGGLPTDLAADFQLNATSTSPAGAAFGILLVQPGITGGFSFTYDGPTTTINGVLFTHGANLLSGTFENVFITGIDGAGLASAQGETFTTGPLTFSSDFLVIDNTADEGLSIALNSILAPLHIKGPGDALANFRSSTLGNFSADSVSMGGGGGVPETSTWIMILAGFAGLGAVLRRGKGKVSLSPAI